MSTESLQSGETTPQPAPSFRSYRVCCYIPGAGSLRASGTVTVSSAWHGMGAINVENIHASLQATRLPNASTEAASVASQPTLAADPTDFWPAVAPAESQPPGP
jgi:hypothetical protein